MRRFLGFTLLLTAFALAGCNNDNSSGNAQVNVQGTWHAPVAVLTCSPADTCATAGFQQGKTYNATMTLTQNGSSVKGNYTYDGAPVSADVSGQVSGNQLTLSGDVSNIFGKVTVDLTGTVSNNQIDANVVHDVKLSDGRSGHVTGSGTFTK